jgi:isovaleryl-CoA dehydrogenase
MLKDELPFALRQLAAAAQEVAEAALAPAAHMVDGQAMWPQHAFEALAEAGLMGLNVPERLGGRGQGLLALALVTEELGAACSSSAICYGMHCVGTKVIQVKASPDQEERYLKPIAEGRHVSSLALSEPGTGSHFYLPQLTFEPAGEHFLLNGIKSFVTSGGHADSYVLSAVAPGDEQDPGTFSCFVVDGFTAGLEWQEPWDGFGMRGNSSRSVKLEKAAIPTTNLLGQKGDELWYVFDVIAPYFLVAMSATYLGLARAALELTKEHLKARRHAHSHAALASAPPLVDEVAEMWIAVTRARELLHYAARLGDANVPEARAALLSCKVEIAEVAIAVTNRAMSLGGGRAYQSNGRLARLMRDARAAEVMAPTTHMLKGWLGRTVLGLPLF